MTRETGAPAEAANDLPEVAARIDAHFREWLPDNAPVLPQLRHWLQLLRLVALRRSGRDLPLLSVVIGPTGAGKSSLLNTLLQAPLSRAGAVRPCTQRPLLVGSAAVLDELRSDPYLHAAFQQDPQLEPDYREHDLTNFGGTSTLGPATPRPAPPRSTTPWAVGDTPDFDSVEEAHHRASEYLRTRAERVILVVNPDKYADRSVWDTVDALLPLGNLVGCVFNKANPTGGSAVADCAQLLKQRGLPPPVTIERQQVDGLLTLTAETRTQLEEWLLPRNPAEVRAQILAATQKHESQVRAQHIDPTLEAWVLARKQRAQLLDEFTADLPRRIDTELPLQLDDALRHQLLERFNSQVEKIDFLRAPRQWVTEGWRTLWRTVTFSKGEVEAPAASLDTAEFMARAYRERFVEFSMRTLSEVRARLQQTSHALPFTEVKIPDDAQLFDDLLHVFRKLEAAIVEESEKIAEGLPFLKRFGFYGSQVAVHAVALLVFIKTGGLTGTEVAVQGLSSPLLAKVVGTLLAEGEASALEARLRGHYRDDLRSKVVSWLNPVEQEHQQHRQWLEDFEQWQQLCSDWERGRHA